MKLLQTEKKEFDYSYFDGSDGMVSSSGLSAAPFALRVCFDVLLVEDKEENAFLVKDALENHCSSMRVKLSNAHDLKAACELAKENDYDLVLLDLSLPDSQGIATLLSFQEACSSCPIIILSCSNDEVLGIKAMKAGAQDYISKRELNTKLFFRSIRYSLERHRMREELERARQRRDGDRKLKSLGLMASGIAHDMNNLLASIAGNAELAEICVPNIANEDFHRHHGDIVEWCQRGSELCEQLLTYSGNRKVHRKVFSLNRLIRELEEFIHVNFSPDIVVEFELDPANPLVDVDGPQMRQVIMNFLKNAHDAIQQKHEGKITIRSGVVSLFRKYMAKNYWGPDFQDGQRFTYFEIEDNGSGICEEDAIHVFDPFFSTKKSGRGLGLATVLGIAQAHECAIKLETAPGKGSCFRVLLPCCHKLPALEKKPMRGELTFDARGIALVADDSEGLQGILKQYVKMIGFAPIIVTSGEEAVHYYREHSDAVSLVLLDVAMSNMSGDEALKHIQEINPKAKVLMMSGYSQVNKRCHFTHDASVGFIKKPFRLNELKHAIAGVMHGIPVGSWT